MVAVMIATSHMKFVGAMKLPLVFRALGWPATLAMAAATMVMFAAMI